MCHLMKCHFNPPPAAVLVHRVRGVCREYFSGWPGKGPKAALHGCRALGLPRLVPNGIRLAAEVSIRNMAPLTISISDFEAEIENKTGFIPILISLQSIIHVAEGLF